MSFWEKKFEKKGIVKPNFQPWRRLYIHKCPFVCLTICKTPQQLEIIIIHQLSVISLHSSFIILHSSFLHFATFKLFSLLCLNQPITWPLVDRVIEEFANGIEFVVITPLIVFLPKSESTSYLWTQKYFQIHINIGLQTFGFGILCLTMRSSESEKDNTYTLS